MRILILLFNLRIIFIRDDIDLVYIDKRDIQTGFPSLFKSPDFADIKISVNGGINLFDAHSIVLASRSVVLLKLIGEQRDLQQEEARLLRVDDTDENLFLALVRSSIIYIWTLK